MSCDNVQERVSSFLDRELPIAERENVLAHINACPDCSASLDTQQSMRSALRNLKRPAVPAELTSRLRVVASHERQRRLTRVSLSARWRDLNGRVQLLLDNMMRPLALPFAGGLASAMMIFGLLFPSLTFHHAFADEAFFTYPDGQVVILAPNGTYSSVGEFSNAPRIQRMDIAPPQTANVVDLMLDQNGRVADWSVAQGEMTQDLANIIMFGQFSPATNMGVPIPSRVRAFQIRNIETPPIRVRS
jgi:anti-sigma factor (TIGR02949 family)